MPYRILAIDLDNTFLDSLGNVTETNLSALHAAEAAGCRVAICTARGRLSTLPVWEELQPISGPHIVFNGSTTYENLHREPTEVLLMDPAVLSRRFAEAEPDGIGVMAYEDPRAGDRVYVAQPTPPLAAWVDMYPDRSVCVDSIADALSRDHVAVLGWGSEEQLAGLADRLGDCDGFTAPRVAPALQHDSWLLELTAHGATKGAALDRVASSLGVSPDEVIGMGDAPADISMLEYAGLGVAVENARGSVKSVADYIAPSADDGGIAHVVERFVLNDPA